MSRDTTTDEAEDLDLPAVDNDTVSTGAAADSSDSDDWLKGLPRLLRYAMRVSHNANHIEQRLVAEIEELCPSLSLNAAWAAVLDVDTGLALASELDRRAVAQNEPNLRSFADCVRLLCLPLPRDATHFADHRRVAKALLQAFYKIVRDSDEKLCCDVERFAFGWAALPACTDLLQKRLSAAVNAAVLGKRMAEHRIAATKAATWREVKARQEEAEKAKEAEQKAITAETEASTAEPIADHHLVVARIRDEQMKNVKLREMLNGLKHAVNVPLPMVQPPPLHQVRNALMFEFPYANEVIDFALADLIGRTTIRLRPLLLVGDPGGGKSRFARRLGEVLGLSVWREDASRADGAVFGGTDRRWYSAEPCHPFLAIAAGRIANPLVLIDEIEKAGSRNDYGRLWDCLLGFLEPETNVRYPDPALQVTLDLSQVSYVATANALDPLPSPIRDRFRIITFPKPQFVDLDALLPAVIADLAKERGLDRGWVPPLDGAEYAAIGRHWRGGSVRRLRRIVEAILTHRDVRASRN
jgi:ATP-dependent Lon protease